MAEKDLSKLIENMEPTLNSGSYIFSSVTKLELANLPTHILVMQFQESEGTTIITTSENADLYHIPYELRMAWITLKIHSALDAVGLTAAFSYALKSAGISCNVVAGYYHDHLFVPLEDTEKAMAALNALSRNG